MRKGVMRVRNKVKSGILGLAVADALGVPVEFIRRNELKDAPVTEMRGNGTHHQPKGTWSDDTSMTLCMMDSLKDGLNYNDMMCKFVNFLEKGDYTAYGEVFDVGMTVEQALINYRRGRKCLECGGGNKNDNGNGSLMRILPIAYYIVGAYGYDCDDQTILTIVHNASALTHRHVRSQIACGIYVMIAITLLKEGNLTYSIKQGIERAFSFYKNNRYTKDELVFFARLKDEHFKTLDETKIKSSGYVVDTLEAAIWCLLTTNTYKECVLKAVNLGEDTDTVAAVAGGLAGIAYGIKGIPTKWLDVLAKRDYLEQLCYAFTESIYAGNAKLLIAYKDILLKKEDKTYYQWDGEGKKEEEEDHDTSFAYPVYDEQIMAFLTTIQNTCYWSTHYIKILESYGVKISMDLTETISKADDVLLGAILTAYIRKERFNDGLIASAIRHQVFHKILTRLEELHK